MAGQANADPVCWTLTDGKIGMVAQALGLAEAVGLPIEQKTIEPAGLWKHLPPQFWPPGVHGFDRRDPSFQPPWPRLLISCGRHAIGPGLAIRRLGGGTLLVHVQHPHMAANRFDLVVAPEHDQLSGPNVIETIGAVHRVGQTRLVAERKKPLVDLGHLPRPLVAVSIGGSNKVYRLSPERMASIVVQLKRLSDEFGASLAVTASRRTGDENERRLRDGLKGANAIVWDGTGDNPYFSFLAQADAVVVTGDSVNMVSEACATGKPVHVIALDPVGVTDKFDRFHDRLRALGAVRPFSGALETWSPPVLDEAARVAGEIRQRLGI